MSVKVPGVRLRIATSADSVPLAALAFQVWMETYATDGVNEAEATFVFETLTPDALIRDLADPKRVVHVAEREGHLLGFAQTRLDAGHGDVHAAAPAELERLYVQARFCGRGLGTRLLAESERHATERGADAIWLTAWDENDIALAFYAARGYEDVGATALCFGDLEVTNRLLVKRLAGTAGQPSG